MSSQNYMLNSEYVLVLHWEQYLILLVSVI